MVGVLKNQHGFGILQALVFAGLLLMGLLGFSHLMTSLQHAENRAETRLNLQSFKNTVGSKLLTAQAQCLQVVPSQPFDPAVVNSSDGQSARLILELDETLSLQDHSEIWDFKLGINKLRFRNAEAAGSFGASNVFRTSLVGELKPLLHLPGRENLGEHVLGSLFVLEQAGNIVGCAAINPYDVASLEILCTAMGANWDSSANHCNWPQATAQEICSQLGGRFVAGNCETTPTMAQLCGWLGMKWSHGACTPTMNHQQISQNEVIPGHPINSNPDKSCGSIPHGGVGYNAVGSFGRAICINGSMVPNSGSR